MKRYAYLVILMAFVFAIQIEAAPRRAADPLGGTGGSAINGSIQVKVVVNGTTDPMAGAFVMVGPRPGVPFQGNWGFTSAAGEIAFNHPDLTGPVTVTAGAAGYTYFSLVAVNANDLVMALRPLAAQAVHHEVGDNVAGIDVNNGFFNSGDGNLDMAFVLPAMSMEDLMAFDMDALFGPMEIIDIMGNPFEIPSNMYIPQQWEVWIEINKSHYYLYLPDGDYTISALSGRIPVEALTSGGDMLSLISALDWRETDIVDVTVSGDTYTADLTVDPDLNNTVTLNLANVPEDSVAFCISVGDLDGLNGLGRLVSLGLGALSAPAGGGPASGSVSLTTTAATGEFAGMEYFPVAAVQMNQSEDLLVLADRATHGQTYTENLSDFFALPELAYDDGRFSWNDVQNSATGSPAVDLQIARVRDTVNEIVYWEFYVPGGVLSMDAPLLPGGAPAGPPSGSSYEWDFIALGLTYDLAGFDFDQFAFSDITGHGSHIAIDYLDIDWNLKTMSRYPADNLLKTGNKP